MRWRAMVCERASTCECERACPCPRAGSTRAPRPGLVSVFARAGSDSPNQEGTRQRLAWRCLFRHQAQETLAKGKPDISMGRRGEFPLILITSKTTQMETTLKN